MNPFEGVDLEMTTEVTLKEKEVKELIRLYFMFKGYRTKDIKLNLDRRVVGFADDAYSEMYFKSATTTLEKM